MMSILVSGKDTYTHAKAYCPISPLSFKQKMMQKLLPMNIKGETFENVAYIYKNLPKNQGRPEKPQCTM
jgi:hypothetical protein